MADVDVRRGRVDAELDAQRAPIATAALEAVGELAALDQVDDTALEDAELFCDGWEQGLDPGRCGEGAG
jgi:hypothetical protein